MGKYTIFYLFKNPRRGMQERNFTTNVPKIDQSSGFKEKENCCLVFPSSTKNEIRHFHVAVVQRRQRKVQKMRDARAKLFFCQSKPTGFLPFLLPSPSSLLKFPR